MINVKAYIGKLLTKPNIYKRKPGVNSHTKISIEFRNEIFNTADCYPDKLKYNKYNLWVAFCKYDSDVLQSDIATGAYSLKTKKIATSAYRDILNLLKIKKVSSTEAMKIF